MLWNAGYWRCRARRGLLTVDRDDFSHVDFLDRVECSTGVVCITTRIVEEVFDVVCEGDSGEGTQGDDDFDEKRSLMWNRAASMHKQKEKVVMLAPRWTRYGDSGDYRYQRLLDQIGVFEGPSLDPSESS